MHARLPGPLLARACATLLTLLLAACGPDKGADDTGSDGSVGDTASTSGASSVPTGDAGSASGEPTTGGAAAGRLVGLGYVADAAVWNVVELDRVSGELIVLASLPASIVSLSQGVGAFDPATRRIFQLTGERQLLTIDADSGAFLAAPALAPDELNNLANLEVNNAGELVGLSLGAVRQTVEIDPETGVITSLAPLPADFMGITAGTGAFDPATDRMFAVTGDMRLLVIDAGTGVTLDDVAMKDGAASELVVNNLGELIGLHKPDAPGSSAAVVRLDPQTGVITDLGALPPGLGFSQGQAVHDPSVDHMFVKTTDALLTIDAATGQLLATTPVVTGVHKGFFNPTLVP